MKLKSIFANKIWSVQYDGVPKCSFDESFYNWFDIEYLFDYFERHKELVEKSDIWKNFSLEELVEVVQQEANDFLERLETENDFDNEFHALSPNCVEFNLVRSKAYGKTIENKPSLLRLYAIKIETNKYVVTGGAIKLVHTMQEQEELRNELTKLRIVGEWLKRNGVDISKEVDNLMEDFYD